MKKIIKDKKIDKFVIHSNKTIREAILLFEKTNGLPLIALNERKEFIGIILISLNKYSLNVYKYHV